MKETFGQRFQRLRKNAGMTQEDVAGRLNISAQAVSKWENDLSAPDLSALAELSDMLGVTTDELLGKETNRTKINPETHNVEDICFRVNIVSADGDKVKLNLPFAILKVFADNGAQMPKINGKDTLSGIDLKQIIELAERGVIGKLVEIETADGDRVEIVVE